MPNGLIHEQLRKNGRLLAFPFAVIFPILISSIDFKLYTEIFIGLGIFIGYDIIGKYVTNDWDIVGMTKDEGRIMNEIPFFGHFLVGFSTTYGSIFRRHHRSVWTHFPFLATGIRYVYLFWWFWYQIYVSKYDLYWLISIFIGMYIGTSISDGIHWMADIRSGWNDDD